MSVLAFIACYRMIFQRPVVKIPVFMENERNFAKSEVGCVPPLYCFAEPFPPFLTFNSHSSVPLCLIPPKS